MFRALGILVLLYVCHALATGEVFAKDGFRGKSVSREENPGYFAAVIAVYIILGIALLTVF
ncbi:MAG TPA: hypothetical protein VFS13_07895 [Steroidobacteraceae bacterium]|jgi:hypothetical protein|nr:hypothetical protein [Steroidobacteraceae bacterium]